MPSAEPHSEWSATSWCDRGGGEGGGGGADAARTPASSFRGASSATKPPSKAVKSWWFRSGSKKTDFHHRTRQTRSSSAAGSSRNCSNNVVEVCATGASEVPPQATPSRNARTFLQTDRSMRPSSDIRYEPAEVGRMQLGDEQEALEVVPPPEEALHLRPDGVARRNAARDLGPSPKAMVR